MASLHQRHCRRVRDDRQALDVDKAEDSQREDLGAVKGAGVCGGVVPPSRLRVREPVHHRLRPFPPGP
jgi:hypothetical protein